MEKKSKTSSRSHKDELRKKTEELELLLEDQTSRSKQRILELDLLNRVNRLASEKLKNQNTILGRIIRILSLGWQEDGTVSVKIEFDGKTRLSENYQECRWKLTESITLSMAGIRLGIEIGKPVDAEKDPFSNPERHLLKSITLRLAEILENHLKQKKMDQDQRLLEDIFNGIQDGISLLDADLNIVNANDWMHKMYLESIPLEGKKCFQVYQRRNSPCPWCPALKSLQTGEMHTAIVPYPSEQDVQGWIELSTYPIKDPEQRVTGVVEYVKDITESKLMQDRVRESEEKHRMLFELAPDGIVIIDPKGRIIDCNMEFGRLFSTGKSKLIGKLIYDFLAGSEQKKCRDSISKLEKSRSEELEIEFTDKKGVKKNFWNKLIGFLDDDGKLIQIMIHCRDITRLKQAQTKLKDEKEYYQTFVESLDDWVWEMDKSGVHTYSNQAVEKILGYKVSDVIGQHTTFLWQEESKNDWELENLADSLASGKGWKNFHAVFKSREGKKVYLESTGIPIFEEGKLVGYRGVDRDITERKKLEESLQKHQDHLKLINRILRHDLSNFLAGINSALNLFDNTGNKEFLKEAGVNLKRSFRLINRMRKMEQYVSNNREVTIVDLKEVLNDVIGSYQDIKFTVKGKARIMADSAITSVLNNIIRNSVIHGKTDKIDIVIKKTESKCVLEIADHGKGISAGIRDKIFDENFKYGKSGHTGLGLYIVKKAMEKYGGSVEVKENQPRGTRIILHFNLVD